MVEAQGRHLAPAELAAGQQPAMPGDHLEFGIDQHRHVEAESLDALRYLPDLLLAVRPRVRRIGLQITDRAIDDRDLTREDWTFE